MDNHQLLLSHAKNMYRMGIQKFPSCSSLRISYAFFLVERLNQKQEALQELTIASQFNPPFDEQFVIYRFKKMYEEFGENAGFENNSNSQQNSQQNVDIMTKFAYESSFRQLKIHIERCGQFHLEFWN